MRVALPDKNETGVAPNKKERADGPPLIKSNHEFCSEYTNFLRGFKQSSSEKIVNFRAWDSF